ncbi:hypothetical protein BDQ17DRAFT_1544121 [Cyathus striatus]|nr:hypothetical protein BDQ17DRAFT_1544121 [Cyathus striatus]
MASKQPSWPSLYNPGLEILHLAHRDAIQPEGHYLHRAKDIFIFTLFWTLLFYMPIFFVTGMYAFWNYTFPPSKSSVVVSKLVRETPIPLTPLYVRRSVLPPPPKPPRVNERRSRLAFALIVLFLFLGLGLAGAIVSSAVLGFATAGLYKAADFHMSTWIPFLLAVTQVVVGLLSVWPSIIDII